MLDLRPLSSASFRHLALGYWINEFGTWIGEIALTILVYDRTRSPIETAALFLALRFAPAFFAPFLTALVETAKPRIVLAVTYTLEAVVFAVIALISRHFSMPAILVLSVLDGVLAITAKALTRSATAADLREQQLLREGNSILNLGLMSSNACAPLIGAGLVAWQGVRSALILDAATFIVTAVIIATAIGLQVHADTAAGFSNRLRGGVNTIRGRRAVRRLMVAVAAGMMLSAIPIPIEVVFAKSTLHAGDLGYGVLLGSWGAGMVLGALIFAAGTQIRLMTIVGMGALVIAIGYGGLAVAPTLAIACIASAVGGAGNGAGWVAAVTSIQERIPLDSQSAVMTVLEGLNQVMPAVGFVVGGVLTSVASPRLAYGAAAVGVALVLLAAAARPIDRVVFGEGPALGSDGDAPHPEPAPQEPDGLPRTSHMPTVTAR